MTEPGEVESETGVGLLVHGEVDCESLAVPRSVLDPVLDLVMDVVREGNMCDGALGPQNIDYACQVSWGGRVVTLGRVGLLTVEIVDCDGPTHSVLRPELLHSRDFPGWLRRPADGGQMVLPLTLAARFFLIFL